MADNYLEKRYDEVFGKKTVVKRVGQSLDQMLLRNRSVRGYDKSFVVSRQLLEQIVAVNSLIASARNQQVLRFRLLTHGDGAERMLPLVKMGAALPQLHLPLEGTEPDAFIIICSTVDENRMVDIDLGISVQSMLLKAVSLGLNGLIIGAFDRQAVRQQFHLPYDPLLVLAIGRSAETFRLVPAAPDDSKAYYRSDGVHCVPKLQLPDLLV